MMTKCKRPYIPKIKGCYECSQRRVHCDRGQPSCAKCIAKNIPCSGLGIRYRFTDDVARSRASERLKPDRHNQSNVTRNTRDAVFGSNQIETKSRNEDNSFTGDETLDEEVLAGMLPGTVETGYCHVLESVGTAQEGFVSPSRGVVVSTDGSNSREEPANDINMIHTSLSDSLDAGRKHLLLHFANNIASELVVIDDHQNGWRYLVLPIANLDSLVMDAVLSAAAFHFSSNFDDRRYKPSAMYANTIRKLKERQNLEAQDTTGKQTVLLALLVLLATVMVNGGPDFPTILKLLESALEAVGGEEAATHGELGAFVVRQIRKFRGYAAPLLNQADGIARLSLTASFGADATNGWECFKFHYQLHPEFSQSMSILYELNKQVCDIYVTRALAGPSAPPLIAMVEKFIDTMNSYPSGSPGEHILVFATFFAAAESVLLEHRRCFINALQTHHRRNGFRNIPMAIDHLQRIWAEAELGVKDWTQLLPELRTFIV